MAWCLIKYRDIFSYYFAAYKLSVQSFVSIVQVGPMVGMPGQMQSGPIPNVACPSQIPAQMRVQLPGQMGGQLQGQSLGQMPGQMTGQMSHMAQMQQPRKVSC
jgi:hypothetical protein